MTQFSALSCSKWWRSMLKIVCMCAFLCIWPGSQTWHKGSGNQRRKPCLWGWVQCPPLELSHTAEQERIHLPGSGGQKQTQKRQILFTYYGWWCTHDVSALLQQITRYTYIAESNNLGGLGGAQKKSVEFESRMLPKEITCCRASWEKNSNSENNAFIFFLIKHIGRVPRDSWMIGWLILPCKAAVTQLTKHLSPYADLRGLTDGCEVRWVKVVITPDSLFST